ncbi:MAG: cell surface protein SprA, partial [Cyclobacteriaceae bacterium]
TIIFPVLEPFGETLESRFEPGEQSLVDKYVYDTLYRTTKADAELVASKNKFFILGKFSGGSSSDIVLPGINVAPNSVVVMAGNTPLTEGLQYTVDYNLGRVRILDQGILSSGKNISISYEKADLFNFQTRWLTGTQFDYIFSDNLSLGATLLHVNERPGGITRFSIGDEPTKNTKYGFNVNYQADSRFLTKVMDALPLVSTKETSNITFSAEVAQLRPGTSNIIQGEGTSYIDDFENAITPINIGGWAAWELAAAPKAPYLNFDQSSALGEALGLNYRRAKMAWYTVDPSVFYVTIGNARPDNIEEEDLENHYVKPVLPQDIYQQQDRQQIIQPEPVFDIAYFPQERGPYNYTPNLRPDGTLPNPEQNWGGITRAITNEVDFDRTNVEYLEFWLMDPFIGANDGNPRGRVLDGIFNDNNRTGGELIFNLGSVSEDVNNDGKHFFENGLPEDGDLSNATESVPWGYTPSTEYLTNFFVNTAAARENQDVGADGLRNDLEQAYFQDRFINNLTISQATRDAILADPSADNFNYYLGAELDEQNAKILERYKNYNGQDGNSPVSTTGITQAQRVTPDNEDLNRDNTLSTLEEYYEYRVQLRPGELDVGKGNIVDKVVDGSGEATWYLFRIPIRSDFRKVGDIDGFKTIRNVRMYMTKFRQPVVLRMAKLQLVGSQWRKYQEQLNETGFNEVPEVNVSDFNVSVVNIEENSVGDDQTSPYVVPPGLERDRDNTTFLNRRNNEQSLQICIEDLEDKDARAVYKNVDYDLINYGRIKMFFHAEAYRGDMVLDDEVTAFIRLGTDFVENYYEIEVPMKITPKNLSATGDALARLVWPLENEIDISINELLGLKSERDRNNLNALVPYTGVTNDRRHTITVKGRPDISTVLTMMIGVRNPESQDRSPKSICLWANELRVTDFDTQSGWAANARIAAKLADVGNISASTRYTSIGFGSIQQRISERARMETLQYDISANINVEKFLFPEKTGLKVPMFASYEESIQTPQFDPLDPDVPLEASLAGFDTEEERQNYRLLVQDRTTRRSLNFTNVRKEKVNKERTTQIYDLSNLSATYAYSDQTSTNVNTAIFLRKTQAGGLAYNYAPKTISITPFANAEWLDNPYLKLIKDINFSPLPSNLSARADINRSFILTQLYSDDFTTNGIDPYYERLFTFNRTYNFRWNLFKSLSLDYSARANAVIDEPDGQIEGDIDSQLERAFVWDQIKDLGRMKNFTQDISASYDLPFDKIPLTDWINGQVRFNAGYNWIAGSLNQNDSLGNFFGHTLQNKQDWSGTGKVDFVTLYNKVGFLKKINTPSRKRSSDKVPLPTVLGKGLVRALMSVRNVNATYSLRQSTGISGFTVTPFLFGMDSGFVAPGYRFVLGSQDPGIRQKAAENGWITRSESLTSPFQQTATRDLNLRASVEPSANLKIQMEASRSLNSDFRETFRYSSEVDQFVSQTPSQTGAYNISFMSISTAFGDDRNNNISAAFEQFSENLNVIDQRLTSQLLDGGLSGAYDSISQDVMVPAFIAAYSGQSAQDVNLRPFPVIPIPSWRIDYAGLSKLPGLSDWFSSINITHGYRSTYAIGNYSNSLSYFENITLDNDILDYPLATQVDTLTGNLIPVFIMNQVTISEQFTPLLGINIRTNNNINARIDFKKDRNLSLSLSNAQVTETTNNDVAIDIGWTKEKLKLPFRIQGRTVTIENDVTFRFNMTIRDAKTIQRKLNGENIISNGNRNFQFRPSVSYRLNNQLDLTMYFDRNITDPRVASTFRRASTSFGVQLRFSLAQL